MEHRTKQDLALINLVSAFEIVNEQGELKYFDVKSFRQLIDYYENEGNLSKAIDVCKLALKQYKYRAEFYITISHLLLVSGDVLRCLQYLSKAEAIAPYENEIILLKARAYLANCQFSEAFDCLETAGLYASREEQIEIHLLESKIFSEMKSYEEMYDALIEVLELDSKNTEALENLWSATELSKRYIHSITFHSKLIDKDPYNHLAWFNMGHAYAYQGEYENAIDALEYSFIIEPAFEDGYMDCADICCQTKKFERALGIYNEAIEVFGVDGDLLTNIAECQINLNKIEKAKYNLYKVVRLDPCNDEVYFLLGECYSKQEKWYSAINAYHKAIEIEDGSEDYYLGLARAYIAVEEYNKATVNFQLCVSIGPEQTKYWQEFASFLLKMGLYQETIQILDEAEDFTFGADLLYIRALTNFFLKDKDSGLFLLKEALLENYDLHHILFALAPELEVDQEINSMIKYFKDE